MLAFIPPNDAPVLVRSASDSPFILPVTVTALPGWVAMKMLYCSSVSQRFNAARILPSASYFGSMVIEKPKLVCCVCTVPTSMPATPTSTEAERLFCRVCAELVSTSSPPLSLRVIFFESS